MLVKIHDSYRMIVAICDKELLGKKFEQGDFQIDLTGNFFNGDEKSIEEVKEIVFDAMKEDATFNAVGKESCNLLVETGVVKKDSIKKISGVPMAMALI